MSTDITAAEEFRQIAGRFTRLVEAVPGPDVWEQPAPPEGWTARDVVGHLVGWFPGFLAAGCGIRLPAGPSVDEDPAGAWRTLSDAVQAVLDDPADQDRPFSNPHTGAMAVSVAIARFFTADVFMHTWDLARATGQDDTLDPDRCAMMLRGMEPLDDVLRSSGQYGPRVPVPDDADPQTRFLAFIGRDPRR